MRTLIFIIVTLTLSTAFAKELCELNETLSLVDNKNGLILKCDCNCTNEENRFYFLYKNSNSKKIDMVEASRLISLNGISFDNFQDLKKKKIICKNQNYIENYSRSVILATKTPIEDQECFNIKEYSYPTKAANNNGSIYYRLNKSGEYPVIEKIDDTLKPMGIYELSNDLAKQSYNIFLQKGAVLKSVYEDNDISIIKINNDSFIKLKKIELDSLFYINSKTYLYKLPNQETSMYLIKGDKITILDEKTDNKGQKWYFINYKGKKDINMWIKAEAVDIKE